MSKDGKRNASDPLRRALVGGALVFSVGLGIGSLAGSLSDTPARAGGPAEDGTDSHRASPPVPAAGERQPEVPLFFVASGTAQAHDLRARIDPRTGIDVDERRHGSLLEAWDSWML